MNYRISNEGAKLQAVPLPESLSFDEADGVPPLISVADLFSDDMAGRQALADQIGAAARTTGFFRICDHGIDLALIEETYAAARRFFDQPEACKQVHYIGNSPNHRGYVPFSEKGDYADEVHRNYEAFDLGLDTGADDADFLAGRRLVGPNAWPEMPGFRDTISTYLDQVSALGFRLCSAFELHLGLPAGTLLNNMSKPISQLRLLHYVRGRNTLNKRSVNMGAHTDYECLTLLHTRNEGLQVMTVDDRWVDVPVDPSALVVNIGDMLEAWTNGLLRSTMHRVLNLKPERFSLPYFVAANHDAVIAPLPQLIEPGRRPRYQPFTAGAHLERMLQRDFPYLRRQLSGGEGGPITNPFERHGAQGEG